MATVRRHEIPFISIGDYVATTWRQHVDFTATLARLFMCVASFFTPFHVALESYINLAICHTFSLLIQMPSEEDIQIEIVFLQTLTFKVEVKVLLSEIARKAEKSLQCRL